MHIKAIKIQSVTVLFIVGLGIGLLFALQINTPTPRVTNPVTPFVALNDTKTILEQDQKDLKGSISELKENLQNKQDNLKIQRKSTKNIIEDLDKAKEEAGLTEKTGRGLIITIADAQEGELTIDSIVHASDLRDIVNLLWEKGADEISINSERIVLTSSIDSIVNTILVNNTKIANPFEIKVTGDQKPLKQALQSGDYLKDIYRRKKANNLIFNISQSNEVNIPAYQGGFSIKYSNIKE